MKEETNCSALTLHAMGEGVFNSSLGEAILSSSAREQLDPQQIAAAMVTQLGLSLNAMATLKLNGGACLEDALLVKERADAFFVLCTVFSHQADLSVEITRNMQHGNVVNLHGGDK